MGEVFVSRKWHEPKINVEITDKVIGITMSIEDYHKALIAEIGNPSLIVTKKALETKMNKACKIIVEEMKNQTARSK